MKPLWVFIGRILGPRHVRRVALSLFVFLTLLGMTLLIAGQAPTLMDWSPEIERGTEVTVPEDSDGDGLPDARENLIGSDPERYATLGQDVADGWIDHWFGAGVDWNDTRLLDEPALSPPLAALPAPLQRPGAIQLPQVGELFHMEDERVREDAGLTGAWWLVGAGLDPQEWDNSGDGIADAWMLMHGLDPLATDLDEPASGDPEMTVREKYEEGLDPTTMDTSDNGLLDVEALAGSARIAGIGRTFDPLDPTRFSSRDDGIADGYLVRFGLDPNDPEVASESPAGDGVTVKKAYEATREHCVQETENDSQEPGDASCPWRERLEEGPLVDPTTWDSLGDGVSDAWALKDPHGIAHPLEDARTVVRYTTEEWDAVPWAGDAGHLEGGHFDAQNPRPDEPFEVTLADLYAYQRPSDWDEQTMGPWWGGLPTVVNTPEGALPPAVALRGWTVQVDLGLGGKSDIRKINATADPSKADTSRDGLTDVEEYYGVATKDGGVSFFNRTDPSDPDSDGDGLTNFEEVFTYGTDPTLRDTSGSFLTDGFEAEYWQNRSVEERRAFEDAQQEDPIRARDEWRWLERGGAVDFDRLGPLGFLHGGTPNILSASSSGDGLKDGQETFPNQYLDMPTAHVRPETDPARLDTSGDGLPDEWKVHWSPDSVFDCRTPCVPPVSGITGWPLDPSKNLSVPQHGDVESDWDVNLAGDFVQTADGSLPFTNGLAFQYDLSPYEADTSGDGIPDMFAIHWGVENVPDQVREDIDDQGEDGEFGWAVNAAAALASVFTRSETRDRFTDEAQELKVVVINPRPGEVGSGQITPETNLLETFDERAKGTWVYKPISLEGQNECATTALPKDGDKKEQGYQNEWNGAEDIPDRVGSNAEKKGVDLSLAEWSACWEWIPHPLSKDIDRFDPWRHDTFKDAVLPDAWRAHYGMPNSAQPDSPVQEAKAGCDDESVIEGWELPSGWNNFCLSWLDAYRFGLDPNEADTDDGGLPDWQEIVLELNPLDPTDDFIEEDWSGDGLPNRVKLSLGLNLLTPDTAQSGLVDGDPEGLFAELDELEEYEFMDQNQGNGNLCLRRGDDSVPNMENRPAFPPVDRDGSLNWTELYDWYVDLGIVHFPHPENPNLDHPDCTDMPDEKQGNNGEPWVLFLREGTWDPDQNVFLGAGTDSHEWDSSGDGVADGWLVYWRHRASGMGGSVVDALNPNAQAAGNDPDEDFVSNLQEYERNRPEDWVESRDGPWWGGSSPIHTETPGGADWYATPFHADDFNNPDLDGDGIPEAYDPFAAIDPDNAGFVSWNTTRDAYETDYPALWAALEERRTAHTRDSDGDQVPDFLDRARVQIVDVEAPDDWVQGAGETISVKGRVVVAEPVPEDWDNTEKQPLQENDNTPVPEDWAQDGWGVANLTVKAYLVDLTGARALVGFAFTNETGAFEIQTAARDPVEGPAPPDRGATVEGVLFAGDTDETVTLPGTGHLLEPGEAELVLESEANDARLQPLLFANATGDQANATTTSAFKQVPFTIPEREASGEAVEVNAVRLADGSGSDPDPGKERVHHGTNATFESRTIPVPVDLSSKTHLMVPDPSSVLHGESVVVSGRLVNEAGTGLSGRLVEAAISDPPAGIPEEDVRAETETDGNGAFEMTLPSDVLDRPGAWDLVVDVVDWPEQGVVERPDETTVSVFLTRETRWEELRVDGECIGSDCGLQGSVVQSEAAEPVTIEGRLVDHRDEALPFVEEVQVRVESILLDDPVFEETGRTNETGHVKITLPPIPPGTPGGELAVTLTAPDLSTDTHENVEWFLRPRFQVGLTMEGTTVSVHQTGHLTGQLLRVDGVPIEDPDATITAEGDHGANVTVVGTQKNGTFEVPVHSGDPMRVEWTVQFAGTPRLHPSSRVQSESLHTAATEIRNVTGGGLRDAQVPVQGELRLTDGRLTPGRTTILAWWSDASEQERVEWTVRGGVFEGELPPRTTAGEHELVLRFEQDEALLASQAGASLDVLAPTRLDLEPSNRTIPPDREQEPAFLTARLVEERPGDAEDRPLGSRTVHFVFTGPDDAVVEQEMSTDSDGEIRVRALEQGLNAPGTWDAKAVYPGAGFEAGAEAEANATLRHAARIDLDRVPATMNPGTQVPVTGRVAAASNATTAFTLTLLMDGENVTTQAVNPDGGFAFRFDVPDLPRGNATLTVEADGGPHVDVEGATAEVLVLAPVEVRIEEEPLAGDARRIHVYVKAPPEARWEGGEVVLARLGENGDTVSTYRVPVNDAGRGTVELGARETGDIHVVAVLADGFRAAGTPALSASATEAGPSSTQWHAWAGAFALVAVAVLAASYAWWRHRQADALRRSWEQALQALQDPDKSPAAVVREAYAQLLQSLARTGYDTRQHTVRDVTKEATRSFRLPVQPMEELSRLFEQVAYARAELSEDDRMDAIRAFEALYDQIPDPLRPRTGSRRPSSSSSPLNRRPNHV